MSCYFYLLYCLLDMSCRECDVISLYFMCCFVSVSVCLMCCVSERICECLLKQFVICLGVITMLLLNGMEVFSVGGGALLDIPCMVFQRMCVGVPVIPVCI